MMKFIKQDHIPTDRRPLGYWLRAIEGPLRENMRGAFATFGVTRREWRTLTTLHAGPASAAEVEAALPAAPRPRPAARAASTRIVRTAPLEQLLDGFVSRGWATARPRQLRADRGGRAHPRRRSRRTCRRCARPSTAGIPDADYATTMATLERIAKNVGWDPGKRRGRGRAPRARSAPRAPAEARTG